MMTKIVFSTGRSGAEVSFPSHQGKFGTCDFMTPKCAKACMVVTNPVEKAAHQFFVDNEPLIIVSQILAEMEWMNADMMSWFIESGDCPTNLNDKIVEVVGYLSSHKVPQNGFTRNKYFWEKANEADDCRICLTVENKEEAIKLSYTNPTAHPNYNKLSVSIYNAGKTMMCGGGWVSPGEPSTRTICGSGWVDIQGQIQEEDCSLCCKTNFGCFKKAL